MKNQDQLWYTKHSGKMLGFYSLSTSAKNNPFCQNRLYPVCTKCYAHAYEGFRPTLEKHLIQNFDLLQTTLTDEQLKVPSKVGPHLRLHSFGELGGPVHARNFSRLAQLNPTVQMTLWTKRPELFKGLDIPDNLSIIWSLGKLNLDETEAFSLLRLMIHVYPRIKAGYYVGTKQAGFDPCGTRCSDCMRCYPPKPFDLIQQRLH